MNNRRRSIRLKNYDYAQAGAYFVTICTHNRACVLGEMNDDTVRLSALGELRQMACSGWKRNTAICNWMTGSLCPIIYTLFWF